MKIALDFDEVIYEFVDSLLEFYNQKKGKIHKKDEIKEYKFWIAWGITKEEAIKIVDEFHETHKIESVKPVEGAIESINSLLHKGDKLFIITARPIRFKKKVEEWINHHAKTDKIEVIHSGTFYKEQAASKEQICKDLGIGVILEDSGETAMECAEEGIKVVLFDKPWNKGFSHKNIVRVDGWIDAIKQLRNYL